MFFSAESWSVASLSKIKNMSSFVNNQNFIETHFRQFSNNHNSLRVYFQRKISSQIYAQFIQEYFLFSSEFFVHIEKMAKILETKKPKDEEFDEYLLMIYVLLCLLAVYEVDHNISHFTFVSIFYV